MSLRCPNNELDQEGINKLLTYYSMAVSHYDTMNDDDTTMFFEMKIKNALKSAALSKFTGKPQAPKNQKKVAQMKLELHAINKDPK